MRVNTHILVVDDEADVELLINQQFRHQVRAGEFSFSFARNGEQALAMLQKDAGFDLMLLLPYWDVCASFARKFDPLLCPRMAICPIFAPP
jgi:DNA-binding NtrC family response regulator